MLVWNINPNTDRILKNSVPGNSVQGKNSWGKNNYGRSMPPFGTNRCFFKIYVLDIVLILKRDFEEEELKRAMEGHILDNVELRGIYK